jgi:hypothetical protein
MKTLIFFVALLHITCYTFASDIISTDAILTCDYETISYEQIDETIRHLDKQKVGMHGLSNKRVALNLSTNIIFNPKYTEMPLLLFSEKENTIENYSLSERHIGKDLTHLTTVDRLDFVHNNEPSEAMTHILIMYFPTVSEAQEMLILNTQTSMPFEHYKNKLSANTNTIGDVLIMHKRTNFISFARGNAYVFCDYNANYELMSLIDKELMKQSKNSDAVKATHIDNRLLQFRADPHALVKAAKNRKTVELYTNKLVIFDIYAMDREAFKSKIDGNNRARMMTEKMIQRHKAEKEAKGK